MIGFFLGLGLMCASTLMYEITLTRLLSVTCWYYLAFVSVSMAMFGMTAGALAVQLRPALFDRSQVRLRMAQASFAMAVSMPIVLMIMFAIPLDISFAVQTVCSFLIFCSIIAVPFFFAGIVVCLSLTKASAPIGRVYFADLMGAAAGCFGSLILLNLVDAPSAVMVISALVFLSASAYAEFADQPRLRTRCYIWAGVLVVLAALNASTIHGIQPIWSKGRLDPRTDILYETWNPISRVRVVPPKWEPRFVGPETPPISSEVIYIDIDNDAATGIYRFQGNLKDVDFLRYEVNSMGARLRAGGSAAVIGVGGGRDVMSCALFGFHRIVGIEINSSIVDVISRRLAWYSGFDKIPNFELHNDEGRSYLTRSHENFDMIQATVVDTWAATAAGAMALTENSLYTLDGWRIFYEHLKPGGIISFSRWNHKPDFHETTRLFSLAYATLLSEGVQDPESHLAMIRQDELATLLTSNEPFSPQDLEKMRTTAKELNYQVLYLPGEELGMQQLSPVLQARTLKDLAALRSADYFDLSPPTDSSPYFFQFCAIPRHSRNPANSRRALGGAFSAIAFDHFHAGRLDSRGLDDRVARPPMDPLAARFNPCPGGRHPLLHRDRAGIYAGGNGNDATTFHFSWAADLFVGRGAGGINPRRGIGQRAGFLQPAVQLLERSHQDWRGGVRCGRGAAAGGTHGKHRPAELTASYRLSAISPAKLKADRCPLKAFSPARLRIPPRPGTPSGVGAWWLRNA